MFGEFSVQELGYAISIVSVLVRFSLGAITTGSIMESGIQGVETHVFEKRRWEKCLKKQAYLYPSAFCLQCSSKQGNVVGFSCLSHCHFVLQNLKL
jgi:hypothetical protein